MATPLQPRWTLPKLSPATSKCLARNRPGWAPKVGSSAAVGASAQKHSNDPHDGTVAIEQAIGARGPPAPNRPAPPALARYAPCCAATCARNRSSRSLSSGVNASPKSSASKIGRISISDSTPIGLGQRLTHSIASSSDATRQTQ